MGIDNGGARKAETVGELGHKIERVRAALNDLLETSCSGLSIREASALGSGAVTALRLIDRELTAEVVTLRVLSEGR